MPAVREDISDRLELTMKNVVDLDGLKFRIETEVIDTPSYKETTTWLVHPSGHSRALLTQVWEDKAPQATKGVKP